MAQSSTSNSVFLSLSHHSQDHLAGRVEDLSIPDFIAFLERTTKDFRQSLKVIDLINNQSLEPMLDELLETFTLKIGQILQAERTTIFVVDEDRQELWSKIAQGTESDSLEIRLPISHGIAGYVATTGEGLNIPDAYADSRFSDATDKKTGYRTRNILCMPVVNEDRKVVAIAQLLNKIGAQPFSKDDEVRFARFAPSIGILLETCQSFYLAARNQKGVAALLKAISSLEQSLNLTVTLQSVMAAARQLMKADRSTLWLLNESEDELWTQVRSADGKSLIDLRLPANKGIVGHVAATGEKLNIPDAYKDERFDVSSDQKTGYRTRNILCMPVFNSSGKLIGVSQLINRIQGQFTGLDESFMRAFNTQAGIALENAQLFQEISLEKQYQKDMLESLSDAVISTDMAGRIVTINESALKLLGAPVGAVGGWATAAIDRELDDSRGQDANERVNEAIATQWQQQLIGRYLWDVVLLDRLQQRLEDSLTSGARHYVPEQSLVVSVATIKVPKGPSPCLLVVPNESGSYRLWSASEESITVGQSEIEQVAGWDRSTNLTVSPLSDPQGGVRGGLVVLEDISQEKRMKTTLYRYMTPSVAERVMALGEDVLMVGERKEVTVLFSDIRGYTSLTEKLEAAQVVSMLNEYFETMVEAVFHCEGTLDKFIGDALMAVFGAPLPLENHAWSAVQSALDMRRRLTTFNAERRAKGQPELRIGVGLSSGEVVSGNIGSQRKMEYTVIGDGVNLSSRLESITKQYGCDIVLSEHTYELCQKKIWVRELDLIRVKGKQEPVKIYELIGDRTQPLDIKTKSFLDLYTQGREAYKAMSFNLAISLFRLAQALRPDDRAIELHLSRAKTYLLRPPAADWDGVHTMTMK
ncbi:adenylate/guanylate cyclase domain-containing protein [cf. Phormidesmis sp. LEGE 11477]|uniref:adenylate/guanylate cyclase domain-containing protein n=1 Tax=cf. Phormidesmis sp. LEGE 11477 TaxID=1828680 RepID=UPI0018806314|nr:adenylate/guanylate cyclase domain-containing protein [cf. Phormidesmis sp. LEGE 11477]MBE9063017.1 GAF domain-containing protein [cf. Phormidesmis sp. LEGE 11477]